VEAPTARPGRGAASPVFSYGVPDAMRTHLAPGHLVRVPFGPRRILGIVNRLSRVSAWERVRDIDEIVDPRPLLSVELVLLAGWMSLHYLAPRFDCMAAMLPPGALKRHVTRYGRTKAPIDPSVLQAGHLAVLGAFGRSRALDYNAVRQRSRLRDPSAALADLVAQGLLEVLEGAPGLGTPAPRAAPGRVGAVPEQGPTAQPTVPPLTPDQDAAWQAIAPLLAAGAREWVTYGGLLHPRPTPVAGAPAAARAPGVPPVCLVHGVTGSGKTELYLRAIERVIDDRRQAIVLVPEIALTAQTVARFAERFGERIAVWHSRLPAGQRLATWLRARQGCVDVIIGSRSAVFAPLTRLGLIVIDEEHASAFKQDRTPRYHARETALRRAALSGAAVLLGSATPSVETYYATECGLAHRVTLPRRIATGGVAPGWGDLPPVRVVDMRAELRAGNRSIFSRALAEALLETRERREQAILFLNRRGTATSFSCRDCGHVLECPRCSLPLTAHGTSRLLACHHCNYRQTAPMLCPACGSEKIRGLGVGTERVEQEVGRLLPGARVVRWDLDTTRKRGAHEALLGQFVTGQADVLVGTQMIAKGLDLPEVTLVGVVSADTSLHLPDPWTRERTFQMLTQVAGRSGRSVRGGQVIFQTYRPAEPSIRYAARHDFESFYRSEIAFRRAHNYPPFRRLVRLEMVTDSAGPSALERAASVADALRAKIADLGVAEADVIGPAPCFFQRVRGKYRWQVVLRAEDPYEILHQATMGPGWRVDVDPVSLL
jgi:primosomal protein N' (replication factor Y)